MKKRVFIAAVLLICAAIVVGVLATNRAPSSDETVITSLTNLKTANSTATTGNKLNFNWLTGNADQQSTFDTSKPALLYDFSVSDTASDFKNGHETVHVEKDGYYSFRIDGSASETQIHYLAAFLLSTHAAFFRNTTAQQNAGRRHH